MRATRRRWLYIAPLLGLAGAGAVGWGAYAAATWLRFDGPREVPASDPAMQRFMPRFDIAEVHRTRVAAPAAVTYDAARAMDLNRSPVVRAIFRAREVLLRAHAPPRPAHLALVDEMLSLGWGVLEEVPGDHVVLGAVTQPWKADVVFRALSPATFAAFDSAGYVKIVVVLAADSVGPRESVFRTETRALATDARSRARFRRYWSIFSPGILLIRSQSLALVRRAAERDARHQDGW